MSEKHQHKKRFGQNFLQDETVIDRIVAVIALTADDHVVEIGPGLGALTKAILPHLNRLDVIEIDRDLILKLNKLADADSKLSIHLQDALKFDFKSLHKANQKLRIIGNLPYNISTPMIFHLLKQPQIIQDMHFMLQKEVVQRIAATPNSSRYGRLSVMVQYSCKVEALFTVPASAFYPVPKVESAIVRIAPYETPLDIAKDFKLFETLVREAFNHIRKTLQNALKKQITA